MAPRRRHPIRAQSIQLLTRLPVEAEAAVKKYAELQHRTPAGFIRAAVLDEIKRLDARHAPPPPPQPVADHAQIVRDLEAHETTRATRTTQTGT